MTIHRFCFIQESEELQTDYEGWSEKEFDLATDIAAKFFVAWALNESFAMFDTNPQRVLDVIKNQCKRLRRVGFSLDGESVFSAHMNPEAALGEEFSGEVESHCKNEKSKRLVFAIFSAWSEKGLGFFSSGLTAKEFEKFSNIRLQYEKLIDANFRIMVHSSDVVDFLARPSEFFF